MMRSSSFYTTIVFCIDFFHDKKQKNLWTNQSLLFAKKNERKFLCPFHGVNVDAEINFFVVILYTYKVFLVFYKKNYPVLDKNENARCIFAPIFFLAARILVI